MKHGLVLTVVSVAVAASVSAAGLPVWKAQVQKETPDTLELWGGCGLHCAVEPTVRASSRLAEKGRVYPASRAHDFDVETAWAEGKPGPGIGEYLEYTFDLRKVSTSKGLALDTVNVVNGYRKSRHLFEANARVRRFRLLVDGKPKGFIDLKDTPTLQTVRLPAVPLPQKGRVVLRFEIVEVYPGTQYQDTVVTDLTFDGVGHH